MARAIIALLLVLSSTSAATGAKSRVVHAKEQTPPPPRFDPAVVNNPATQDAIGVDAEGPAVLRAQVLLDRAHFSTGEIDGHFGANMWNTVKAYQASHGIEPSGTIDAQTWQALNADTAPAVIQYTIAADDVKGPFEKIPQDMMAKAKLPALSYSSPLEELGERFHCNPKLLQTLNRGVDFSKEGVQITVPNVQRAPLNGTAALVVVSKACSCVEVFDADNKILAHYPATMGSEHDPLPVGEWKLSKPLWNPDFHYNPELFWDAKATDAKATIKPGPNNPVGVVWVSLSKEHYGIHGTPEPSTIGKTQSHGCIRLTNWDATEFANMVQPGMRASLREG